MNSLKPQNFKLDIVNLLNKSNSSKIVTILVIPLIALPLLLRSVKIIPVGYVGLQEINGLTNPKSLKPGVNLVNPFSQISLVSTRIKDVKQKIEASSQEGLKFEIEVSKIIPSKFF